MPIAINGTGTISGVSAGGLTSASNGRILQVVSTTKTDTWSETTSGSGGITNTVTGLTVSITPTSASSKILVLLQVTTSSSNTQHNINVFLYRGTTQICLADANGVQMRTATGQGQATQSVENFSNMNVNFLDSPATTSQITYSIKFSTGLGNTNTIYLNRSSSDSQNTWMSRGTSTITVMEVAG